MNDRFLTDEILNAVPRALGLVDRQAGSETYGCADRAYWHYRQIDFANARFQETGLLLAYAWATPLPESPYHRNARLLDWIVAIWSWWRGARTTDGVVAEAYPNERSFCATAFGAAGFVETASLLKDARDWQRVLPGMERTMRWLAKHGNPDAGNQMAASYLALAGYAEMTGGEEHRLWAGQRRDAILAMTDAGVLPEYGGFDAGYQSLSLAELTTAGRMFGSDQALVAAVKDGGRALCERFTSPAGFDPALNARRTQYIFPSGLTGEDGFLENELMPLIEAGRTPRPSWLDDRYFIGLATDYLRVAHRRAGAAED